MGKYYREYQHKIKYKCGFSIYVFEYDTAVELAKMVKESGCKMPNPYEPGHIEYDEYNETMWSE